MSMNTRPATRGKPKVRPPRKIGPETSMKDTWTKLSYAIKEIQNHNVSKLSYEEHYRYAYNMVLFKHGDQLYNGVRQLVIEHLDHLAVTLIVPAFPRSGGTAGLGRAGGGAEAVERALEGDRFLKSIKGVWEDHTGSMRKVKDVLRYMDKVYTQAQSVPIIYEVGLHLFLLTIIRSPTYPIHTHLIGSLLSQVQLERDGETITRTTVRDCVDILLRLQDPAVPPIGNSAVDLAKTSVYSTDFEPELLRRSGEFYESEAGEILERGDAGAYLRNVEKRLLQEIDRTAHYLSHLTQPALLALVVSKLLTPHLHSILHMPGTGLRPMLEADRIDDIRRLYSLFVRVPNDVGRQALRQALKADVEDRGKAINDGGAVSAAGPSTGAAEEDGGEDEEMEGKGKGKGKGKERVIAGSSALVMALRWVQDVLDLKDKFDRVLEDAFGGDKGVQTSLNEAFQSFINANPRAPEYLSLFIDEHLKKGTKTKSEDEIEIALEKTIILFRFLSDKDRFERYYKNHLAKRLLYARSASDDSERGMVAKLKVEMGFQFTQKLEGMFNDMRLSAEGANTFRNYLNRHGALPLDLQVSVLTTSHWPPAIIASSPLSFPAPLSEATAVFQTYYDSRHSGRRLTWQGNLGTADVRVRFKARSHDVNCSTQALVVLLAFEEIRGEESVGYQQLKSLTSVPDAELVRTLQSLACGKFRLLLKTPKGREVSPTDVFAFNEGFTCSLARIKIMQVAAARVETGKEREETEGMVVEERRFQVEACIVRIMKNRKTMGHNDLISDVAHQLSSRFIPSTTMIKQRIEGLIDREYLERGDDIGTYRYLA